MGEKLDFRSAEVLRCTVEVYTETGEPVGSGELSRRLYRVLHLSPATIRSVMAGLEGMGLIFSPHISSGRVPTQAGLRLFVDTFVKESGELTLEEQEHFDAHCPTSGTSLSWIFEKVAVTLSSLSQSMGLIVAPEADARFRRIEFVSLSPGRAMVVMITEHGIVENRVIDVPIELSTNHLDVATNYLNQHIVGKTLQQARVLIEEELKTQRAQLGALAVQVIKRSFATIHHQRSLVVRGQSNLLRSIGGTQQEVSCLLELFEALETQGEFLSLLDQVIKAEGVRILIGSEHALLGLSECAMVVAPYSNSNKTVVGAIGVIGPTRRMSYSRVIPMVNYTAKLIGNIIG